MKKSYYAYMFVAIGTSAFAICSLVIEHNILEFAGWSIAAIGYISLVCRELKK